MGSIFDILGPVMVGPSSSHTAGAARIGYTARQLFGEPVLTQERYEDRSAPFDPQHPPGNGHRVDLIIRLRRQKHTFLQFLHDPRQIIIYIYLFSVHRFLLKITLIHCPSCLPGSASPVSHIRSRSKQFSSARSLSIFFSSKSV